MTTGVMATAEVADVALTTDMGPRSGAGLPDWFRTSQRENWTDYLAAPSPVRREEAWRFASVGSLDLSGYASPLDLPDGAARELVERSQGLGENAGRMIFANDRLLIREEIAEEIASQGVVFAPLETALTEHPEIFRRHFMTQEVALGSKKFAALHRAMVSSGTFLYVPKNVEVSLPLEVFHWLHGEGGSTFPHTLLVAEAHAKVTLLDYFQSADRSSAGLSVGVNDLILGDGATVNYICVQDWSDEAKAFQINSTQVGRDAHATSLVLNLGSKYARHESVSRLTSPGGRSDMLAVNVAAGTQEYDQRTLQDHQAPNTESDLLYKNSLSDASRTIFAGLIKVERGAHQVDAYQKVRNLLLSDEAEANSMPGLEILADQVKCSHGATTGQIDEEEMFYLLARGITPDEARNLIVKGFLNEAIERLGEVKLVTRLNELVADKFARMQERS